MLNFRIIIYKIEIAVIFSRYIIIFDDLSPIIAFDDIALIYT
jgi:hypothetical protein